MHPCASTNKRFLVWLYLNLCIHSSNNAIFLELLLDVLHVPVHLLQGLVVLLEVHLATPRVRQVQREKQDALQYNEYPSCASAGVCQEIHMFFPTANAAFPSFFNLKEAPSNLTSRTETWLHQPDTEPRRARSRIVQMIC